METAYFLKNGNSVELYKRGHRSPTFSWPVEVITSYCTRFNTDKEVVSKLVGEGPQALVDDFYIFRIIVLGIGSKKKPCYDVE